jgi:hypothetical protein
MWQMDLQFFASFPDLLDDISPAEPTLSKSIAEQSALQMPLRSGPTDPLNNTGFGGAEALDVEDFLNVYGHDESLSVQRLGTF